MADADVILDDIISGWEADEIDAFLESDNESYSSLLEEQQAVQQRKQISMADTQAAIALHTWSVMSSVEKKNQIIGELKNDQQNVTFHRLPSALNLTL